MDGTGNFQNIPEHITFLNEWFEYCRERFTNFWGTSNCSPLAPDAKIELVPNFIFLADPQENNWNWDNTNEPDIYKLPDNPNWWLNALDASIVANPTIPKGINVYLTINGPAYTQLVTLGTITDPQSVPGWTKWAASQHPTRIDMTRSSRISFPNLYLLYWQYEHDLYFDSGTQTYLPFSVTRPWLITGVWGGSTLAHEYGHSFISDYVHFNGCTHHLMTTGGPPGSDRTTIRPTDVGYIHRNLALSNLRQFVQCDESYNPPNTNGSDRVVNANETWDLNMRLYSNVVVKPGATLTLTCELLMPQFGTITVERGARLVVDGGNVRRANTCSPTQFWWGVFGQGNPDVLQPDPNAPLVLNQSGIIRLKNNGMIEGAIRGAATKGHPLWDLPEWRGAVVDATDFTFKDCRKGVEFMQYDFPNRSKFERVTFERTTSGSMYDGVSMWENDGILFEECTFKNMAEVGIRAGNSSFNVTKKNLFTGGLFGILTGASSPLTGLTTVGQIGLMGTDRNRFINNIVGIKATGLANIEILSNDFASHDFNVAILGAAKSVLTDNFFEGLAAGNQFQSTGTESNKSLCNRYLDNIVGTNIVGQNSGYDFRQEDFAVEFHDLFIEGIAGTPGTPGSIPTLNGNFGSARWNFFTAAKPENIKTSTVQPNNLTNSFYYFHPDPAIDARLKPTCALNGFCAIPSNFTNVQTLGDPFDDCMFPSPPGIVACTTFVCLEAKRSQVSEKTTQLANDPNNQSLAAELEALIVEREFIIDELIQSEMVTANWSSIENILNGDLNPFNRRRLFGAKLEQNQLVAANSILQAFPQNSLADQHFVAVQTINLARLNSPGFSLNSGGEAILLDVAESASPEAGYAQTLLTHLTGQLFMPRLPDLGGERSSQSANRIRSAEIRISPNPADELIRVDLPFHELTSENRKLEIRDFTSGRLIQQLNVMDEGALFISINNIPSGIYLLTLSEQNRLLACEKLVVQH